MNAGATRCIILLLLAAGCAAPTRPAAVPIFFPPAPELPRIQYLTSFSGLRDIEKQSAFDRFIVGEKPDLRVDKPYGVAVHEGKIYVCDSNSTVAVFDFEHGTFGVLKGAAGRGALRQPLNITIDGEGNKYVSDPVRGQVVVFDRNDEYANAYGTSGAWQPIDAAPYEDRLYVVDRSKRRIAVLDRESGELVRTIGDRGDPAELLDRPTNLAFDREGYLYVTDVGRFQVVKYDRDGHFQAAFGKPGDNLGHFARPRGIALDRSGRLYAVDASFNNVQIFNPAGRLLMFFGEGGDRPGAFLLPAKVTLDYDNLKYFQRFVDPSFEPEYLIVVTSQFGKHRVNVFAFGHEKEKKYPSDAELLQQIEERWRREHGKAPQ